MNIKSNAEREAELRFNTDPDYRQNPYKKDSRDYHIYLNTINTLETKEQFEFARYK